MTAVMPCLAVVLGNYLAAPAIDGEWRINASAGATNTYDGRGPTWEPLYGPFLSFTVGWEWIETHRLGMRIVSIYYPYSVSGDLGGITAGALVCHRYRTAWFQAADPFFELGVGAGMAMFPTRCDDDKCTQPIEGGLYLTAGVGVLIPLSDTFRLVVMLEGLAPTLRSPTAGLTIGFET